MRLYGGHYDLIILTVVHSGAQKCKYYPTRTIKEEVRQSSPSHEVEEVLVTAKKQYM